MNALLTMQKICKAFPKPSGAPLAVLQDIDISFKEGEILGLLGRSGSGKSTLLRIAAGLIEPTSGEVLYRGVPLTGPEEGIAVVFQTFALYPWLTVIENVELGLDALGLPRRETRKRTLAAIDLIGLDGFQSAYPRELSGGMRQRVGFARAMVINPSLLLMDEPFSSLDVLTAETLRTDFLDLWIDRQLPTKAVLMVTHNIEEAVLMCDRILILASNPGHITAEIPVTLPHPRNRLDPAFHSIVEEIYAILTSRAVESIAAQSLPAVSINRLDGLIEALASSTYNGHAKLAHIAGALSLEINDFFPIAEGIHILKFAELGEGSIKLTMAGKLFAQSGVEQRKQIFKEHLLHFVPLAAHIRQVLDEREDHRAPLVRFKSELEDHLNPYDAQKTLHTLIDWGRYAELFSYDARTRMFHADHADEALPRAPQKGRGPF